jgi:hypothetical protein
MSERQTYYEEWDRACRIEREAWAKVSGRLPGSARHDPVAWKQWQDSLQRSNTALQRYVDKRSGARP